MEFVSKDEMDAHGWAEMSDIEKRLNFAEDDWAYDTRNLAKGDNDLQTILKNKFEIYAKNKPAREALSLLREQLSENRSMFERIKGFYNEVKALSAKEADKRANDYDLH